ncbi:MAG: RluA family pseudouridine synthase [Fimbriimonadaceae bacterium]|nr:MAG: RluA family pseudouridine synthase [Fimbriimonadaceae bacterium]
MNMVADGKERLDHFLSRHFPGHSRAKISKHIESGAVSVNGEVITKSGFQLKDGNEVSTEEILETAPHALEPVEMDLDVRFEDDELLVVNKPRGLAVHPANTLTGTTLVHGLLARSHGLSGSAGDFRPGIVHRLDKETTGLIIVAKTDAAHAGLSAQIQARTVQRRYVAVINGDLPDPRFTIDAPLGRHPRNPLMRAVVSDGKSARTHIQSLRQMNEGLMVACRLETGRTHQIRVHLAHFGWPVLGDDLYAPEKLKSGPMQLHAASLTFQHPSNGKEIALFCPPPDDFYGNDLVTESEVNDWE